MAGYCTLVLYFHSPAARENTAAHSCNIQPYYLLTHQLIYIYIIHVHTTDNVRPKQCPHALSNKLQVFYENLQVFYENLQVFYGI